MTQPGHQVASVILTAEDPCNRCGLWQREGFFSSDRCSYEHCPYRTVAIPSSEIIEMPAAIALAYARAKTNGRLRHIFDWDNQVLCWGETKIMARHETAEEVVRELGRQRYMTSTRKIAVTLLERMKTGDPLDVGAWLNSVQATWGPNYNY